MNVVNGIAMQDLLNFQTHLIEMAERYHCWAHLTHRPTSVFQVYLQDKYVAKVAIAFAAQPTNFRT